MESKYSKLKVNNEVELCRVADKRVKNIIEKALLAERISYFIKWEKPSIFSSRKNETCVFCINEWQIETAENAIANLGEEVSGKVRYVKKKIGKTLF